jgi:hypothetical protein
MNKQQLKQAELFPAEDLVPAGASLQEIIIDGKRALVQHLYDVPRPRVAILYPNWQGRGQPTWVLDCELVVDTFEEARAWVKDGTIPGDDDG